LFVTDQWRCESLRLSALWPQGRDTSGLLNWETVVGVAPDQRYDQPKIRMLQESGQLNDYALNLELRTAPGRLDWLITPILPSRPGAQHVVFDDFPDLDSSMTLFKDLVFEKSAQTCDAPRLAIGVAAVLPRDNRKESYAHLARLLPDIRVPLQGASELFFQINRPRPSTTFSEISINRMSRWMAIVGGPIIVSQFPTLHVQAVPYQSFEGSPHATRVDLDISTQGDRQSTLPLDVRKPLFDEMLGLAKEIIFNGDLP